MRWCGWWWAMVQRMPTSAFRRCRQLKKQTLVPCNGCAQLHYYYQNRYLIVWQMNGSGMAQDARSIGNASGVTIYYGNFIASKCGYLLWLAVEHVISFARCPSMTRLHQTELFLDATVSCAQNSWKLLCDAFGAVMSFSQNSLRDGRTIEQMQAKKCSTHLETCRGECSRPSSRLPFGQCAVHSQHRAHTAVISGPTNRIAHFGARMRLFAFGCDWNELYTALHAQWLKGERDSINSSFLLPSPHHHEQRVHSVCTRKGTFNEFELRWVFFRFPLAILWPNRRQQKRRNVCFFFL